MDGWVVARREWEVVRVGWGERGRLRRDVRCLIKPSLFVVPSGLGPRHRGRIAGGVIGWAIALQEMWMRLVCRWGGIRRGSVSSRVSHVTGEIGGECARPGALVRESLDGRDPSSPRWRRSHNPTSMRSCNSSWISTRRSSSKSRRRAVV